MRLGVWDHRDEHDPGRPGEEQDVDANPLAIETEGLVKCFGETRAVDGIDLAVQAGTVYGVLGPNGAGKTTTMRMIMGLTTPSSGEITVFGLPPGALPREHKARIGLVPQDDNLDPDLSVRQNLDVYGRYFSLPAALLAALVAVQAATSGQELVLDGRLVGLAVAALALALRAPFIVVLVLAGAAGALVHLLA